MPVLDFSGNRKALSNTWIIIIVSIIFLVLLGAIVAFWLWSGNLKTEEMEFSDFTAVDVRWAFEVRITQSSSFSVVISADEKIFDKIEVNQIEDTLVFDLDPGTIDPTNLVRKAEIKMPDLNKLIVSGASRVTVEGFSNSNEFTLGVSGASSLDMSNMNVGNAEIDVSGASTLDVSGTAQDLRSTVTGASKMDLSNFSVNSADVEVYGASQATINLNGVLNADLSGASRLEYIGEPTMGDINTDFTSTVEKK